MSRTLLIKRIDRGVRHVCQTIDVSDVDTIHVDADKHEVVVIAY